jgi:hypothetical protein
MGKVLTAAVTMLSACKHGTWNEWTPDSEPRRVVKRCANCGAICFRGTWMHSPAVNSVVTAFREDL